MKKFFTFLIILMLLTPSAFAVDPTKPMAALTFDDGPSDHTLELLEVLTEYGCHATFFMVGKNIKNHEESLQAVIDAGCEIGVHSWKHQYYTELDCNEVQADLERCAKKVASVTDGYQVVFMRPPYGAKDSQTFRGVRYAGMIGVLWTIDTRDWEHRNAQKTADAILKSIENGSVILCHETVASTVEAMRIVLPQLIGMGYQILTVSELYAYQEGGAQIGKIYARFTLDPQYK